MRLRFLGANQQVTGSRYCLEAGGSALLVDCGLFQEREFVARNWAACPVAPDKLDALLLTHVHIDHCGLTPKLIAEGFRNPIYATPPSVDLAGIMLRDSARIQKEDAEYKKKRHRREGRKGPHPEVPLYTEADVEATLPLFREVTYGKPTRINDVFTATFHDAGHILGSAMIEIVAREDGAETRIVFSGDIGQWGKPLIRDPSLLTDADYVVMESTYGDSDHEDGGDIETQLREVIVETVARGGQVLIPTFAVERAQELMYYVSRLVHSDAIPDIPVFLDSPMAVDVTEIFRRNHEFFDEEFWDLMDSSEPPLRFQGLRMCRSAAESRQINEVKGPALIMATSGMCTAGRIKHHLRREIERPESTVLFVGYQGRGTLGQQILSGRPEVRIHGRNYQVKAQVARIRGFSGHADRGDLLRWLGNFKKPRRVFLTHGEKDVAFAFAKTIEDRLAFDVRVPFYEDVVELE